MLRSFADHLQCKTQPKHLNSHRPIGVQAEVAEGAAAPRVGQSNIFRTVATFFGQKTATEHLKNTFFSIY